MSRLATERIYRATVRPGGHVDSSALVMHGAEGSLGSRGKIFDWDGANGKRVRLLVEAYIEPDESTFYQFGNDFAASQERGPITFGAWRRTSDGQGSRGWWQRMWNHLAAIHPTSVKKG